MLCPKAPPDSPKEATKEVRKTLIRTGIKATLLVCREAEGRGEVEREEHSTRRILGVCIE
jgi:hypothetical protein